MRSRFQDFEFQHIAPTLSIILVSFLNVASQILFRYIDPAPLTKSETTKFNLFTAGLFICYFRTWLMDPGRIPKDWNANAEEKVDAADPRRRWCRKCEMPKPPRAHHCKSCKRCIPKMDHHCPWTANCVSHRTMPHFIRFLTYGVLAAGYLEYLTITRLRTLYSQRHLPSYLGPTIAQLITLFVITIANTITLTGVGILLLRTLYSLLLNTTTIESWEQDRHATLLRRARHAGGMLDCPDGTRVRIEKQEFPYDIGLWANMVQAMGTRNVLLWAWPFAGSRAVGEGTEWEVNGFDDRAWPPVDPDRLFRVDRKREELQGETLEMDRESFRRRQEVDLKRLRGKGEVKRRKPFYVRLEEERSREKLQEMGAGRVVEVFTDDEDEEGSDDDGRRAQRVADDENGEEGWRNSEGERLADFGVDEDVEFYDEDDLPLAELMRRRKQEKQNAAA